MKKRLSCNNLILFGTFCCILFSSAHRVILNIGVVNLGFAYSLERMKVDTSTKLNTSFSSSQEAPTTCANCSIEEMERLEDLLWEHATRRSRKKNREIPRITKESNCPEQTWLWEYLRKSLGNIASPFVGVFVGCNKGFDAIQMASRATNNPAYNKTEWVSLFREHSNAHAVCSADQPTEETGTESNYSEPSVIQTGEFHCIEAVQATATLLTDVSQKMGLQKEGFTVSNVVMSNYTGTVDFVSSNQYTGSEFLSIELCASNKPMFQRHCVKHPVYSLDDYASKFIASQGMIDLLTIDTEGYDYPVLIGGSSVLTRTKYLEFEVSKRGSWAQHSVLEVIGMLADRFHCYIAGKGRLFRITGCLNEKMRDLYDRNYWMNVACVSKEENRMVEIMEKLFRESLRV